MNFPPPSRLLGTAVLLSALLAGGCGNSADDMLASARDYLAKNDQAAATIQLKNALAKNPNSAEARFLLGRALLESGDAANAEIELRKALELKQPADQVVPVLARALLAQGQIKKIQDELTKTPITAPDAVADFKTTLAQTYAGQGKFDRAQATFQEAVAARADHAPALLGLARLKIVNGDVAGAKAMIEDILAKSPKLSDAWQFKADLLRAENNLPEAIAAYQKAVEARPQALTAHAALIMIHLRDQKPELAAKQFDAMQKAAGKHPLTLYLQGLTAYSRKDLPATRAAMDALLKVLPDNAQALQLAGLAAYDSRADVQAQDYLAKAIQKAPGLEHARRILILSQLRSGQPAKALATLKPVLQGDETGKAWLTLAGNVHMQNGDAKTAEEYFTRAARAAPGNQQIKTSLALARMQTGHADQSLADLERIAVEDTGTSADMALISSHLKQKQYDKALKAIDKLEKKQPDDPVAHNLRGGALLGKRDVDGARKSFEKALSLNPAYLPAAASLAQLDLAAKKPDDARKRFEAVLAKDAQNVQAMLAIADLRARGGANADEVAGLIAKAVAAVPSDPTPRLALIRLHLQAKNNDKALTAVQEAMAAIPNRPEILDVAGSVFQMTGDINQALATYGKLASLLPSAPHPYLRMAEIQVLAKNNEGARASLNKGLALLPDSLSMQRALIMLDVAEQRFTDALAKARAIQKSHAKEPAGYVLEGDTHIARKAWGDAASAYRAGLKAVQTTDLAERLYIALHLGDKASDAASFADSWLKSHPKDNGFRLFMADSANKRKDFAVAVAQYRTMLAAEPNNPMLLNNLAWSLGQQRDPKALEVAEQAFKLAPNHPAIMDTLGMLLVERGQADRGLELLGKAIGLAPQAGEIRLNYAKGLLKAGKKADAKRELETLAKRGDQFAGQAEVASLLKGL